MKILFILPYAPVPPTFGGALRVCHIIRQAAKRHDVSILTFGWPEDEDRLREYFGASINGIRIVSRHWPRKLRRLGQLYSLFTPHSFFHLLAHSKYMQWAIDEELAAGEFDIVQVEFSHMGTYVLNTGAFTVLDAHNVEYENFRRMWQNNRSALKRIHYFVEHRKFYREEIATCRKFNAVLVTSGRDMEILDRDVPAIPKYVVPNGVDTEYFTPAPTPPSPHALVFSGAMSYLPNHDGIHYFLDSVFPLIEREIPDVTLTVVGSNPPETLRRRARKNIIITGFVDDVRPHIWNASVYVVPLRMGSGTRLKILEALSMNIPVVTTTIGTEGIRVAHEDSALIADTPAEFAASVVRLLREPALRRALAAAGKKLVHAEYDWNVIGNQLDACYRLFRPAELERPANRPVEAR